MTDRLDVARLASILKEHRLAGGHYVHLVTMPDDSPAHWASPTEFAGVIAARYAEVSERTIIEEQVRTRLHERVADYFMRRHEMDPHTIASDVLYIIGEEEL